MADSLLLVIPGLIWGASFLFIAEGLDAMSPSGVTFARILVGFLTLSLVPAARRPIHTSERAKTIALGVVWMAFPLSMFPFAEQRVSSALTGMLNGLVPMVAAVVASVLARRAPARAVVAGLTVGLLGAILIAAPNMTAGEDARGQTIGILLILSALVSYGFAYSLATPLQQRNGARELCLHRRRARIVEVDGAQMRMLLCDGCGASRQNQDERGHGCWRSHFAARVKVTGSVIEDCVQVPVNSAAFRTAA